MSLALLFNYLLLNMFRMLIHPSSGACDLFVELLHGLYCSGSMCVGVTLWFGWSGVVSGCRLKHYWSVHVECGGSELMTVWNRGVYFSWALLWNEFAFMVEGLDIVLPRQYYVQSLHHEGKLIPEQSPGEINSPIPNGH